MSTAIHRHVEALRAGASPHAIGRTKSGWAVIGATQFLRGYCLLLPDPVVADLNALDAADRAVYLADMASLGDAVRAVTGAVRINYAILGNLEPALHAHVIPRFVGEDESLRTKPPFFYDWNDPAVAFDARRDAELLAALRAECRRSGLIAEGPIA